MLFKIFEITVHKYIVDKRIDFCLHFVELI